MAEQIAKQEKVEKDTMLTAFRLMSKAKALTELYEANKAVCSKYVHATSRGHEAIQLACGLQLKPQDFVFPYYRDDSILLGIGITPFQLMLQVLAKKNDPFSGGRTYYSHPSLNDVDKPKIPHQSSATGMQAIPATGVAMGIQHKEKLGMAEDYKGENPVVVCSLGDASCTEGEVSEAFQMAVLKQMPIIYLVQDNEWDISATAAETRAQDITHYAKGFKGMDVRTIDGTDFQASYETFNEVLAIVRKERRPFIIHAKVPLPNHHTSGVRMEFYRHDKEELAEAWAKDPFPKLYNALIQKGVDKKELDKIENEAKTLVASDYELALKEADPQPTDLTTHMFAPTPVTEEKGQRAPAGKEKTVMVDSALFAIREIMEKHPESLLYGQDVGARIGGVFREAATLAQQFGDDRVYNTPIQEAFIVGSTVGMSAVGLKPIVEVQFADYIWPGLNQLFTEVGRSYYLSNGKWPVSMVLRVPIGAYGSGGPYHSSSIESIVTNIRGVKVAYPSTGADLKGLMKAAYYDPNPVVMLEHKGLYWSKIKGTEGAMTVEPDEEYIIPFGKARTVLEAPKQENAVAIITYGMGVYWSLEAAKSFNGQVEIIDLRTVKPLDYEAILTSVKKTNRLVVLEEAWPFGNVSTEITYHVQANAFDYLDAPIVKINTADTPAAYSPVLMAEWLPNHENVITAVKKVLYK